jgi:hypothetical protein
MKEAATATEQSFRVAAFANGDRRPPAAAIQIPRPSSARHPRAAPGRSGHALDQGAQQCRCGADPIGYGRTVEVDAFALIDFGLAMQWQSIADSDDVAPVNRDDAAQASEMITSIRAGLAGWATCDIELAVSSSAPARRQCVEKRWSAFVWQPNNGSVGARKQRRWQPCCRAGCGCQGLYRVLPGAKAGGARRPPARVTGHVNASFDFGARLSHST